MAYTTLAAWPLAIAKALDAQGFDAYPLFSQAGLNQAELLEHPSGRVNTHNMSKLWQLSQEATQDPAFGLSVAKYVQPMHFNALGLLILTCEDLAQVLEKIHDYGHLISNSVNIKTKEQGDLIGLVIEQIEHMPISSLAIDGFFATFMHMSKDAQNKPSLIKKVELHCPTPSKAKPWFDLYDCPIQFNSPSNILWLDKAALKAYKIMGDKQLAKHNEALVKQQLDQLQDQSWTARTRQVLIQKLDSKLTKVAEQLSINERSLRRYLQEENTNFREILQQVRMELCRTYLINQRLSITDTALKLGFSDSSNFSRAFVNWFGQSPSQFKTQTLLAAAEHEDNPSKLANVNK